MTDKEKNPMTAEENRHKLAMRGLGKKELTIIPWQPNFFHAKPWSKRPSIQKP